MTPAEIDAHPDGARIWATLAPLMAQVEDKEGEIEDAWREAGKLVSDARAEAVSAHRDGRRRMADDACAALTSLGLSSTVARAIRGAIRGAL